MMASLVYGAIGGGALGAHLGWPWSGYAVWGNTVWSFANAGWAAVDCLKAAGC